MELLRDTRRNALAILTKTVILGVFFLSIYNLASFLVSTDDAVDQNFSSRSELNLYRVMDTLSEPGSFWEFRESAQRITTVAEFYNQLNEDAVVTLISSFTQSVPVRNFRGDERFDEGYGTDLQIHGISPDPETGEPARDVKSLQLNQKAWEFYSLHVASGSVPDWKAVDFSSPTIPIVLGADYAGIYRLGDILDARMYFEKKEFEVVGFLEPNSAIFSQGEINYFLDSHIVVPYPSTLPPITAENQMFYGILSFAMVNGDLVAEKSLSTEDVLARLQEASAQSGFDHYSLIGVPAYLVQFAQVKSLIQNNLALVAGVHLILALGIILITLAINVYLSGRRASRHLVLWNLGYQRSRIMRMVLQSSLLELALVVAIVLIGHHLLPQDDGTALLVALVALCLGMVADACHQQHLLRAQLTAIPGKVPLLS